MEVSEEHASDDRRGWPLQKTWIAEAKRTGMKTLRENGIRYVLDGTTSIAGDAEGIL